MVKYLKIEYEGKTKKLFLKENDNFSNLKIKIQSIFSLKSVNFDFFCVVQNKLIKSDLNLQKLLKNTKTNFITLQIKKNQNSQSIDNLKEVDIKIMKEEILKDIKKTKEENFKNDLKKKNKKNVEENENLKKEEKKKNLKSQTINDFIDFNSDIHSPYMTIFKSEGYLLSIGFIRLKSNESWQLKKGQGYYIKKNYYSTLIAFFVPLDFDIKTSSFKIISSNVDFACLRLSPVSKNEKKDYLYLDVEKSGESNWESWKNRDLSLGGRVVIKNSDGSLSVKIYNSVDPIGIIGENFEINKTCDHKQRLKFYPLVATKYKNDSGEKTYDFILESIAHELGIDKNDIQNFDLCLSSSSKANIIGVGKDFMSGPRMNNLISVWSSLMSFMNIVKEEKVVGIPMIILNNNSESHLTPIIVKKVLDRVVRLLNDDKDQRTETSESVLSKSFELRCFPADSTNFFNTDIIKSILNNGVTVKTSNNYFFPTNSVTKTIIDYLAKSLDIQIQEVFDLDNKKQEIKDCWIKGVDLGIPIMSLGSIRETVGVYDVISLNNLFNTFFEKELPVVNDDFDF